MPNGEIPPGGPPPVHPLDSREERNWALAAHLSSLCAYVGIPFGNVLAPLVIWLIKREESPFIDDQGKEALNFNISVAIYGIVAGLMVFVLIGFVLLPLVMLFHIVCTILAAIAASKGEAYRYPLTLRLIV